MQVKDCVERSISCGIGTPFLLIRAVVILVGMRQR